MLLAQTGGLEGGGGRTRGLVSDPNTPLLPPPHQPHARASHLPCRGIAVARIYNHRGRRYLPSVEAAKTSVFALFKGSHVTGVIANGG